MGKGSRKFTPVPTYYRDQTMSSRSPGSVTSPTGNPASSSSQPVLQMHGSNRRSSLHGSNRRSALENTLSQKPPYSPFLVEAHALWYVYSSARESNPLSSRIARYCASRLHAKYVLHVLSVWGQLTNYAWVKD